MFWNLDIKFRVYTSLEYFADINLLLNFSLDNYCGFD